MASGKVKWFDNKRGFGFIAQDCGADIFVHYTQINGKGFKTLREGEMVNYELVESEKGLKAQNVKKEESSRRAPFVPRPAFAARPNSYYRRRRLT